MRLVNSCEGDLENLVKATLYTGARLSELIQLTVEDFNVDFGTISIRQGRKPRHILLTGLGLAFFSEICANRCGTDLLFKKNQRNGINRVKVVNSPLPAYEHESIRQLL